MTGKTEKTGPTPDQQRWERNRPSALLALSFLVTLAVIAVLGAESLESRSAAERLENEYLTSARLAEEIVYYDEVLTQSARLAATTGDPAWQRRYHENVVELDRVILKTRELGDSGLFPLSGLNRVDSSNQWLIDAETRSFALSTAGQMTDATSLIFGDEYQTQKREYASGLAQLRVDMQRAIESGIERERRNAVLALVVSLAAVLLSTLIFAWSWRALRRWHAIVAEHEGQRQDAVRATAEQRFRVLTESSVDVAFVVDRAGTVSYVSAAVGTVLGWDAAELLNTDFAAIVHPDDRERFRALAAEAPGVGEDFTPVELRIRRADSGWRTMEVTGRNRLPDSTRVGGLVLNTHDVTERVAAEERTKELLQSELAQSERLRFQAEHDSLTGLSNRAALQRALSTAVENRSAIALLMVDIDGFKDVNDGRGHQTGDRVLSQLAERLHDAVRDGDMVARIGGDEFAVLVRDADRAPIDVLADRLLFAVAAPLVDESGLVELSASVGIAGPHFDDFDVDSIMGDADLALYRAKHSGGNCSVRFETELREEFVARIQLSSELERAVVDSQFVLYYQPIWDLRTTAMHAVETLVRWQHPTRGLLTPEQFLPLAEESGMISRIDATVLRAACKQAGEWRRSGESALMNLQVGVNVSAIDLSAENLVDFVRREVTAAELPPHTLVIEVTETAMMDDLEAARQKLTELSRMGVRLALDDFGTGYSSLSHLTTLDFDVLKIDRAFVRSSDEAAFSLAEMIVALARLMNMGVVAEGIETAEQLAKMRDLGCDYAQGFLLGRPMPAAELEALANGSSPSLRFFEPSFE